MVFLSNLQVIAYWITNLSLNTFSFLFCTPAPHLLFRRFKFTLKPPYSITCSKLQLAIWDTSFQTFLLKFGHNGPWDISQDLFWSFLKYVNFWWFQGHLSTFQKMGGLRKSKFSRWRSNHYPLIGLVLGGEVPRLNHGPICFPIPNTCGVLQAVKSQVPLFWHFHKGLKCIYYWCIASRISP